MSDVTEADRQAAQRLTGCRLEKATDCPFHGTADCGHRFAFCAEHDEDGNPAWEECRWAPVAAALAAEREKARAPFLALAEKYYAEAFDDHHAGFTTAMDLVSEIRQATEAGQ